MNMQDCLYGNIVFDEPVIRDLLSTPTLERLKGVDTAGYFEVYFPKNAKYSRFEHSVGVAWLLKRFGASLEEQIAGLLHDVSHSAFSHAIDYAVSQATQATQSYQDDIHEDYVQRTGMPAILERYGFSVKDVLDDARHPLQERDLPDLCADRIDYILRGAIVYRVLAVAEAQMFLENLEIKNGQWIFKSYEVAREFSELFRSINRTYYSGIESALMFRSTGDWLAYALKRGYISFAELYSTDEEVIEKINRNLSEDPHLQKLWLRMNNKVKYHFDSVSAERTIHCKSRMVDPLCFHDGMARRVSAIDSEWGNIVREESKPKEYHIVFED